MPDEIPDKKDQAEWDKILRQAWITTTLERDKAIITLSSAGLGLLVTLIFRAPVQQGLTRLFLIFGLLGFAASIVAGVRCLHVNRDIILREIKREAEAGGTICDKVLIFGFGAGITSVFLFGIVSLLSP